MMSLGGKGGFGERDGRVRECDMSVNWLLFIYFYMKKKILQ
jgi:hypothetical protein